MERSLFTLRCLVLALSALITISARAVDIEPPKAQLVDKFGVNMANGQITHSLNTVSIGSGGMGLSHSVSVVANEFDFKGFKGFKDKYYGQARNVELSTSINFTPNNIMRVYDFLGSADFAYVSTATGAMLNGGLNLTSGYAYKPLGFDQGIGDDRQILEVDSNDSSYLKWTHPDGTVSRYYRGAPNADATALLVDVTFPNGLVITVTSGGMSITTNTGFQLKAVYVSDTRGLPSNIPDNPNLINAQPVAPTSWAANNPAYMYAINNAYEYCTATATTCSFTNTWPRAEFHWPGGMPRRMYLAPTNAPNPTAGEPGLVSDDSVWVKDAKGQMTAYYFKPYDVAIDTQFGTPPPGYTAGIDFSPRIIKIAPYGTQEVLTYDYKNIFGVIAGMDTRLSRAGAVISGKRWNETTGYDIGDSINNGVDTLNQVLGSGGGIYKVQVHGNVVETNTALYIAETQDGRYTYESSPRNFITMFEQDYGIGPTLTYSYTRSNLTTISYNNNDTTVVVTYPADCVSTPRSYCNKPMSVKDQRGNYTYYTYHTASGQVATVTSPADKNGITPQKRYEYTQLSAHYYNGGGKITGSPIWMKTAERYCISSNPANGINGGSCNGGANDEVITRYEYNNDNLLMTGMTVTAFDPVTLSQKTLRTCFQYDIYGNQIGKTEPNANLSACN